MAHRSRLFTIPALAAALLATAASAQDDEARRGFVEANLLGIFYHELGHALIDLEEVPIFGQEEDAADVFSILLVDSLFDEETAQAIAIDAAYGFLGEVYLMEDEGEAVAWWDVHGPDEQRFYNTVCLFYGANPDEREAFAEALGLPEERAGYCPDEFDQAFDAWGDVLDGLTERFEAGQGEPIVLMPGAFEDAPLTARLLEVEVAALNGELRLSLPLSVWVESCGEPNAYYDPETAGITMCTEFEAHLHSLYDLVTE
ncbi:DUF4344 domain-containing metallopeptidase [Pseudoruegeria sp. SHC-113]|uniref:DUF4344 domain-containing metallopeptidase n=1 Tax=Pseudoruegeria sp. SHC-113 TaxID=2855439 RepID=UPI0021BB5E59|nr:DUF4344 domain-containing metallopeptidase [Pseudoruegeria sp. SHC-113]MCT8161264.1 DUF4344 domain-containing metallopeptidase [Pseudoruegeria sp. SHC-113]